MPGGGDAIPNIREFDASPHRKLHEHRMFGIRAEMAVTVLLDRSNFVDLVLVQSIRRKRDAAVAEREAGHRRKGKHSDFGARNREPLERG